MSDLVLFAVQVFLAIVLGAMGASQAQIAFPEVASAGGAIQSVFGVIDRKPQQPQLQGMLSAARWAAVCSFQVLQHHALYLSARPLLR